MGDLKRTNKFKEKEVTGGEGRSAVKKIVSKPEKKTKMISASVNIENYEEFTKINTAKGMSNNSCLNMLIADYIKNNG